MFIDLAENWTRLLSGMIDLHAHYNLGPSSITARVGRSRLQTAIVLSGKTVFTSTWSAGEYYPERVIAQRDSY